MTAGNIPYIGLIVPNIVSLYKGDNVRENIWHTCTVWSTVCFSYVIY